MRHRVRSYEKKNSQWRFKQSLKGDGCKGFEQQKGGGSVLNWKKLTKAGKGADVFGPLSR